METKVVLIDPKQYGLEETQATQIVSKLSQIVKERELLFENYEEVCKLEITHENIKKFKECRLAIANNRTKELEPARKADKEFFLRGGQFVDASYKREITENERREAKLKEAETHFERLESQRIEKLRQARISECEPFQEFIPFGIDLGLLNEEGYASILNGAKIQYEVKVKAEQEAEAARLKAEEEARIEREKEAQRIESQRLENERLRKEAEEKENLRKQRAGLLQPYIVFIRDYNALIDLPEDEFKKQIADIQRGASEQWEFERKQRQENEAKLESERKAAQAKIEKEKAEARRLAAELQAKKDAEIKAEKARKEAEEKARKEAEELAKAPMKKQLTAWVEMFTLPQTELSHELVVAFQSKHEAMKNWCKSQIELL
jgi:hypothetical protein